MIGEEAVQAKQPHSELVMGKIYAEVGDYDQALRWYDQAARGMDRTPALREIARLFRETGHYREAASNLQQAIIFTRMFA